MHLALMLVTGFKSYNPKDWCNENTRATALVEPTDIRCLKFIDGRSLLKNMKKQCKRAQLTLWKAEAVGGVLREIGRLKHRVNPRSLGARDRQIIQRSTRRALRDSSAQRAKKEAK